jgi:predicted RNA binding protein YcfA (HicA-like mRNA interferase family)
VSALRRVGYLQDRQHGSHIDLRHADPPFRRIVVPDHKELATDTLRAIIRETGLTVEEFRKLH